MSKSTEQIPTDRSGATPARVSAWFMFVYALTVFGIYVALFTPLLATLAVRIAQIVPVADRATSLGAVLAPGAFAALIAAPIFGALSDRTRSQFGRRKFWIAMGCAFTLLGLVTMALGTRLWLLGIGWFVVQIGANAAMAGANALLADLVPENQRGRMAALLGVGLSLSFVAGPWISQFTLGNSLAMFIVPWCVCPLALVMLFAAFKDRAADAFPPLTKADVLSIFWVNPVRFRLGVSQPLSGLSGCRVFFVLSVRIPAGPPAAQRSRRAAHSDALYAHHRNRQPCSDSVFRLAFRSNRSPQTDRADRGTAGSHRSSSNCIFDECE
jgi:MFS family permease